MEVDIQTEIEINRPRPEVAADAMDPETAPRWYENIESVEWKTPKPIRVGSNGFSKVTAPLMKLGMRRANRKDLKRVKSILESGR
ncbi:MAG: hypothetical protein M3280_12470 [Actinomycetota bacterium]|nr:hypothetical protein [Actinomycetota bacterium]